MVSAIILHSKVTVFIFCGGTLGDCVYILVFPNFVSNFLVSIVDSELLH